MECVAATGPEALQKASESSGSKSRSERCNLYQRPVCGTEMGQRGEGGVQRDRNPLLWISYWDNLLGEDTDYADDSVKHRREVFHEAMKLADHLHGQQLTTVDEEESVIRELVTGKLRVGQDSWLLKERRKRRAGTCRGQVR